MVLLLDPSFCFTGAFDKFTRVFIPDNFFSFFFCLAFSASQLQSTAIVLRKVRMWRFAGLRRMCGTFLRGHSLRCCDLTDNKDYNSKDNRRRIVVWRVLIQEDGGDHTTVRTRGTRARCQADSLKDRNTPSQSESVWTCKTWHLRRPSCDESLTFIPFCDELFSFVTSQRPLLPLPG